MDHASALAPGTGRASLFGYATVERAGAALDVESRLRSGLPAFAQAWAGASKLDGWRPDYGVMGGLTYRW